MLLDALATYNTLHPDTDPEGPIASLIKDLAREMTTADVVVLLPGAFIFPPGLNVVA